MKQFWTVLMMLCGIQLVAWEPPVLCLGQQISSNSPTAPSDLLADELWRIANTAKVRMGFESVDQPMNWSYRLSSTQPTAGTLKQALNAVLSVNEIYDWRLIDDVLIIRPKTAWSDANDPLNQPVPDLNLTEVPVIGILRALTNQSVVNRFEITERGQPTASLRVDSATVIDVLNKLIDSTQDVMWVADYRQSSEPRLTLSVRSKEITRHTSFAPRRGQPGR